jgi:hypothetical protein
VPPELTEPIAADIPIDRANNGCRVARTAHFAAATVIVAFAATITAPTREASAVVCAADLYGAGCGAYRGVVAVRRPIGACRDAAYENLSKTRRQTIHAKLVQALEEPKL